MEARAGEAAEFLSSMANPKRLLVLCHLLGGERSVGEMAAIANLSSSALSQHLTKMRLQGLVRTRRDAQTIYYSIASPNVEKVLETLYGIYCAE
jgi:DNA-binding transcriptional ArsR family regulator